MGMVMGLHMGMGIGIGIDMRRHGRFGDEYGKLCDRHSAQPCAAG
jgi:hypothetical protein